MIYTIMYLFFYFLTSQLLTLIVEVLFLTFWGSALFFYSLIYLCIYLFIYLFICSFISILLLLLLLLLLIG